MPGKSKKRAVRSFLQVANWKMNKTIREAHEFIKQFMQVHTSSNQAIWFAVPFTDIRSVHDIVQGNFEVGAQNMNDATSGAYTGEIAAQMLLEAGATFVIVGHSERRKYFHEDDAFINRKVLRALESSLKPILCIGETYDEREDKATEAVLEKQLSEGLKGVSSEQIGTCIIAYEPVWAIGTGKTATPEIVEETHASIRNILEKLYDAEVAKEVCLLYGGSVSAVSAQVLSKTPGVDGFLIGTASLDPESFAKIIALSENDLAI
jgi:triosephosphate isomerase (TIM)